MTGAGAAATDARVASALAELTAALPAAEAVRVAATLRRLLAAVADDPAAVRDGVAALRAIAAPSSAPREIERKYLLRAMPPAARRAPSRLLAQGYLPGEALVERVRRVRGPEGDRFWRTVKLGAGAVRVEVEEETTRELFAALWRLTRGRRVRKRRHVVDDGALRWEVDRFLDRDLVLAEVELPSADAPVALPAWLAAHVERDVTDDGAYTNARLAR